MENIYFQPTKENSEFLAKLEKLDEYTIPQILERMVDHFRNLPELEDALNKLGIKTDSLEEELDDDIRVEERFYVGGKPKMLRHFKGDNPTPILEKEWYQNGQLKEESYINEEGIDIRNAYYISGQKNKEGIGDIEKLFFEDGQLAYDGGKFMQGGKYFDKEGNEVSLIAWSEENKYGRECQIFLRDNITGEYKDIYKK